MPVLLGRRRASRLRHGVAALLACLGMALGLVVLAGPAPRALAAPEVLMSSQSEQKLESLLAVRSASAGAAGSELSEILSRQFLGVPYGANTLIGSASQPERLVAELQRVDCFTFADYIEALKRADSRDQFITSLAGVRYKDGVVGFDTRKHFFTDWSAVSPAIATDITSSLAGAVQSTKSLNQKDTGGVYLAGLPVVSRTVSYIPSQQVDSSVLGQLRTGDYIGAYANDGGLDVTHVGIYVATPNGPVLRNASSLRANNAVVDSPLLDYLKTVPGVVVLRPVQ